ncbi:MAG: aminotransferase class V-fold PLP-dependent enzyme [Anaerolineae bacterium]|nr:aminotransferase class V-fold PLP-dependent enzyme [Anaerolineae bacterium]
MTQLPAYDLEAVRRSFPIAQRLTYLNHASIAPVPTASQEAMDAVTGRLGSDPQSLFVGAAGDPLGNVFVTFSSEIAAHINAADPREVVGVMSTSAGINTVAQAIDWQPGDNIVFCNVEFPSNVYPWMVLERRGVECRLAPSDNGGLTVEAVDALADANTRLVAVSAVQFLTGHRADLVALGAYCRARGILFVVDAIQAAGHIPIDVQAMQIDVLVAGGQKSLMGPPGQGFLYVRDAVCAGMLPGMVGPTAVEGWEHWLHYDLTPREGAARFMMGTPNIAGMFGVLASVRFLRELGIEHIDAWTRHLSQVAIEDLVARGYDVITPTDPARHGPIVTFRVGDPNDMQQAESQAAAMLAHLAANDVRVSKRQDAAGWPHLRISTHCYNTENEVRRVGALLEEWRA